MNTKEKVTLWHSLLNTQKEPEKWFESILENGIEPSGGEYLRENCVYFHKPEESIYDEEILDKPAIKLEIPKDKVYATNLSYCSTGDEFKPELWEKNLTPYQEFEPDGAAEYVVKEEVAPSYIEDFYPEGPQYKTEENSKGWQNQKMNGSNISTAAELFT